MDLMLWNLHLLSIQRKRLFWARGVIFVVLLSCANPISSPRLSLSKVILTVKWHYMLDLLLLYFNV